MSLLKFELARSGESVTVAVGGGGAEVGVFSGKFLLVSYSSFYLVVDAAQIGFVNILGEQYYSYELTNVK